MFIKEELELSKTTELQSMCKDRGISIYRGKGRLNKTELIEALVAYGMEHPDSEVETVSSPELKEELKDIVKDNPVPDVKEVNGNEITQVAPWVVGDKDVFIEKAEVGTLMAFLDSNGKPRSGKMVNRSAKRRMVKLVTEYDAEYTVSYDMILWVKFGTRWPKTVYQMLKEYKNGKSFVVTVVSQSETAV